MEKVTQGSRRTVEFSLPIGIKEETIARKIIMRIKKRMDSIGMTSYWTFEYEGRTREASDPE
jgi:hypothetical protein